MSRASDPALHRRLHLARLRYYMGRLEAECDAVAREYLAREVAFERAAVHQLEPWTQKGGAGSRPAIPR